MEAKLAQFEAMAAAKDEANELLQRKIDGLIAENATIKKQIELQPLVMTFVISLVVQNPTAPRKWSCATPGRVKSV